MGCGSLIRWVALVGAILPLGCSFLLDSHGLVTADDVGVDDAGVDGATANDATANDAGDTDGPNTSPEAGSCEGPNAFCDDFDSPTPPRPEWLRLSSLGGTTTFDATTTTSPSNALRITSNVNGRGDRGLRKALPITRRAVLAADFRHVAGGAGNATLISMEFGSTKTHVFCGFVRTDETFYAEVYLDPDPDRENVVSPIADFPRGTWKRVELDVDLVAAKLTLRLDGVERTALAMPKNLVPTSAVEGQLGIFYADAMTTSWETLFDTVTFRTE